MVVSCQRCTVGKSKFVCQECGRTLCERCFDPVAWLCSDCEASTHARRADVFPAGIHSWNLGALLFSIGFSIIFIGIILLTLSTITSGIVYPSSGSAIVLIGPFPILFGAGIDPILAVLLGVGLTVVSLVVFFLLFRILR